MSSSFHLLIFSTSMSCSLIAGASHNCIWQMIRYHPCSQRFTLGEGGTSKGTGNLQHSKCGKSKIAWGAGSWEIDGPVWGGLKCKREEVLRNKQETDGEVALQWFGKARSKVLVLTL